MVKALPYVGSLYRRGSAAKAYLTLQLLTKPPHCKLLTIVSRHVKMNSTVRKLNYNPSKEMVLYFFHVLCSEMSDNTTSRLVLYP